MASGARCLVVFVQLLAVPVLAGAQTVGVTRAGPAFELRYTASFSADALTFGQTLGYDTVQLVDGRPLAELGRPMLPTETVYIALPAGMTVTDVRLTSAETVELPGEYSILPAQPPRPTVQMAGPQDLVPPDRATYASSAPYPAQMVRFVQECDLAGQALAVVELRPVQYRPAERKLSLCTSLTIVLEGVSGYVCGDYLPAHISAAGRAEREQAVASLVVNPDDIELITAPSPGGQRGVDPGDYDYVIITTTDWVSAFQPLADWKTRKGVPANIVTLTWIYSTYSGSTNPDKIRAFVEDAYANWGTTYFLMGGDSGYVPCHMRLFPSIDPDPVPNDTYYADFDSDWIIEVNIGRASVNSTGSGAGGIAAFISKIMTFEKTPPTASYPHKAGLFGFDLDDLTHCQDAKVAISDAYLPPPWSTVTVYDDQGGDHHANVMAVMNMGQMLMNHADHSGYDIMGVGYVNHGWLLTTADVDALTNGDRQGILYSMSCHPCAFDHEACIAEHFVRNIHGGGIAFVGNTRYGFYMWGEMNSFSLLYDQYFFHSLVQENFYKLGAAVADHKNDGFPRDDYYRYIWTELTLLGDPELPVWLGGMSDLTVTHPDSVDLGAPATFTVHVTDGLLSLAGATVCLWKPADVYLIQQTDSLGNATFAFTPGSTGTLNVTVTKQHYLPYEGDASVVGHIGDMNCDGIVDFADINPFVLAIADPTQYQQAYPSCYLLNGDINLDGVVSFADINPFVNCLASGSCP